MCNFYCNDHAGTAVNYLCNFMLLLLLHAEEDSDFLYFGFLVHLLIVTAVKVSRGVRLTRVVAWIMLTYFIVINAVPCTVLV